MDYLEFLESKRIVYQSAGLDVSRDKLSPLLFKHEREVDIDADAKTSTRWETIWKTDGNTGKRTC